LAAAGRQGKEITLRLPTVKEINLLGGSWQPRKLIYLAASARQGM